MLGQRNHVASGICNLQSHTVSVEGRGGNGHGNWAAGCLRGEDTGYTCRLVATVKLPIERVGRRATRDGGSETVGATRIDRSRIGKRGRPVQSMSSVMEALTVKRPINSLMNHCVRVSKTPGNIDDVKVRNPNTNNVKSYPEKSQITANRRA